MSDLNIALIRWLCRRIGIGAEFIRSSELDVGGTKAALLVDICVQLEADRYVSAAGSRSYIDESDPFPGAGITLVYQSYSPVKYAEPRDESAPNLSALDLLFYAGPAARDIVRAGADGDGATD